MDKPKPVSTKKGTIHQLHIESTAFKGKGVGKIDDLAVFVAGTAPGDFVEVQITKRKKKYREAKLLQILKPSTKRIQPHCQHANVCGGCSWQHLSYSDQLLHKRQQVEDHMRRIAKIETPIDQAIASDQIFHYRNKMEYSFGTRRWLSQQEINSDDFISDEGFFGGLHAPGRYDKILPLNACYLQDERSYQILDWTRKFAERNNLSAYDQETKDGYFRNLAIRNAYHSSDFMVNVVSKTDNPSIMKSYTHELMQAFPSVTTIVNNIQPTLSPVSVGVEEKVYHGSGYIVDKIGNHEFIIHPNAFFQTNTAQAEKLYEIARDFAQLSGMERVYDLYCGVGTLTLYLSEQAKHVLGVELNPVAIKNARFNADTNNIKHVDFVEGDMQKAFSSTLIQKYGKPDVLLTDPPRAGMHPDVVKHLLELQIPRIVYVSCDSSTMARDLFELKSKYEVKRIQPVDMFPQTYHIETVALLELK